MRQFGFYAARLPLLYQRNGDIVAFPKIKARGKKTQLPSILMLFVSSLWCEINRVGGVSCNYYWSRFQEMKSVQQKNKKNCLFAG